MSAPCLGRSCLCLVLLARCFGWSGLLDVFAWHQLRLRLRMRPTKMSLSAVTAIRHQNLPPFLAWPRLVGVFTWPPLLTVFA